MSKLKEVFEKVVNDYIRKFEKKQDIFFDGWVGDRIGEVAIFGDWTFYFEDIRYDIDTHQFKEKIIIWYDLSIKNGLNNNINYRTYCKLN